MDQFSAIAPFWSKSGFGDFQSHQLIDGSGNRPKKGTIVTSWPRDSKSHDLESKVVFPPQVSCPLQIACKVISLAPRRKIRCLSLLNG